jgi:glutamine amidotransferase
MQVAIIDYGMGNVASVQKAFLSIGISAIITRDKSEIENSKFIVLPGVGAFKQGMENLKKYNLVEVLNNEILNKNKPFLGICLGMQLIAEKGTEVEDCEGLGWIKGNVVKIYEQELRVPHLGWNDISTNKNSIIRDFDKQDFYFIHSFHFNALEKNEIVATVEYGNKYVAAIQKKNILAVQFHPEKSQNAGVKLLKKFIEHYA